MRTIFNQITPILFIMATVFTFTYYGCKKADLKSDANSTTVDEKTMALIKSDVASQMAKEGGIPQIFTRNQPVKTMWVDKNGNPVTKEQMQNNNFTSACNYDLPAYCNLVQYSRVFRCAGSALGGPGYFLQFEYEISWNNNIVTTGYGGNKTTGTFDIISDVTGSSVYPIPKDMDVTNSDVRIVEIGQDPNQSYPNNYIFRVKFVTTDFNNFLVLPGYINGDVGGTYTVKLSALFATNCKNGGNPYSLYMLPVTTYGFTGASGNDPCQRNEKAWVTAAGLGGTGTNQLTVTGYNSLSLSCGYGSPFIQPHLQQVEYNVDGGAWQSTMSNTTASGTGIDLTPYIRASDVATTPGLPNGDHLIGVRYRNWKYIGTSPIGWPVPSFTNDCFSPGDNPSSNTSSSTYSTYAYQYVPCYSIP